MQKAKNVSGRYKDYITYFLKTRFKFNIHSPFVYDFADQVLEDFSHYPEYDVIEKLREKYTESNGVINIREQKKGRATKEVSLSRLIKGKTVSIREGRLLFRIVRYYKPEYLAELGTSLGIGTLYQALGAKEYGFRQFSTIEECENTLSKAAEIRDELAGTEPMVNNIEYVSGDFESILREKLKTMSQLDYILFDGQRAFNMNIFHMCLDKAHEDSIFIIKDIYRSRKMKKAWETVKIHPKVRTTIDLFRFGIAFFNNPYARQNFTIRF